MDGESLKKFIMVDVGFEPTNDLKKPFSVGDAIFCGISGVLVRLTTHLQKVNR